METMKNVIIIGEDQYRRNRAASVLRTVQDTRDDLLEYIYSLEDHEGNLDIHCDENTSAEIKTEILEFFTKVWELHNECSVWIDSPIYKKEPGKTMENEIAYYQIKKGHLTQGNYSKGYNIAITMVGAYTSDGKWIKWVSLESFIQILITAKIKP